MGAGTRLGQVRGLGSSKHGAGHWLTQRMTALGNFALFLWFLVALVRLPGYDHATVSSWLASPWAAVPMLLLVLSVFWHIRLGLQVLVEDYVHDEGYKLAALAALNFYTIGLGVLAAFAILKLALTGTAQ